MALGTTLPKLIFKFCMIPVKIWAGFVEIGMDKQRTLMNWHRFSKIRTKLEDTHYLILRHCKYPVLRQFLAYRLMELENRKQLSGKKNLFFNLWNSPFKKWVRPSREFITKNKNLVSCKQWSLAITSRVTKITTVTPHCQPLLKRLD